MLVPAEQMRMHLDGDLDEVLEGMSPADAREEVSGVTGPVSVRLDQVSAGVASVDAASAGLATTVSALQSAILGRSNAGTWGGDAAGEAFAASYLQGGGPAQVLFGTGPTGGQEVVTVVADAGRSLTESLALLLGTDQDAAAEIAATDGA